MQQNPEGCTAALRSLVNRLAAIALLAELSADSHRRQIAIG